MADQVLYSGVACITDLMVKEGLINLDFADVRAVMREMGKAMMGTGEASGEKRALRAAEAAISNPLIDDVSMRGAKGLLVSITGGNDLTLYEVDEAATRIREEVDSEANIIVGATFDESLEGVIRVSVVATGVDAVAGAIQHHPAKSAETKATARAADLPPPPAPTPHQQAQRAAIDAHGTAAVAAALLPKASPDDLTIKPIAQKPSLFIEPITQEAPFEPPMPAQFIPPQAERPQARPRMPRIDELPMPAQNQLRARERPEEDALEKPRMSLLQRLASVGLGRKDGEEQEPRRAAPRPMPERMPRPAARQAAPAPSQEPVSEYAKRPQGLDHHGRQQAVQNTQEDDQLEIPAFLRRQAN